MNQNTIREGRTEKKSNFFQRKQLFNTKPLLGKIPAGDYIVKVRLLDKEKKEITSQSIPVKITGGVEW